MISREELQRVKEYTRKNDGDVVHSNIWAEYSLHSIKEDNKRFLDLLEAAEHYAREDTLKEVEDRLMPEGMTWPRFEDGARLHLGDFMQFGDRPFEADSVTFGVDKTVMIKDWVADRSGVWRNGSWLSVKRLKPCDTWEKLEEDAQKDSPEYWMCRSEICSHCPSLVDGKKPKDFYLVDTCTEAQRLDLVARAKRLAEGGGMKHKDGSPQEWRDRVWMKVITDNVVRYGDAAFVRERTCQNVGGREGTNSEYYDFECSACGFMCDTTDAKFCPECGARVTG